MHSFIHSFTHSHVPFTQFLSLPKGKKAKAEGQVAFRAQRAAHCIVAQMPFLYPNLFKRHNVVQRGEDLPARAQLGILYFHWPGGPHAPVAGLELQRAANPGGGRTCSIGELVHHFQRIADRRINRILLGRLLFIARRLDERQFLLFFPVVGEAGV